MMEIDGSELRKWLGAAAKRLERLTHEAVRRTTESAATYARLSRSFKHRSYNLRRSIQASAEGTHGKVTADAPYAYFVENGTKPHPIPPERRKVLRFEVSGEIVYRLRVFHPGTSPRLFMTEAQKQATPLFERLVVEAATNAFQ